MKKNKFFPLFSLLILLSIGATIFLNSQKTYCAQTAVSVEQQEETMLENDLMLPEILVVKKLIEKASALR